MALGRRANGQEAPNIWPGFVDAMTALLLVLFFVLSIFMIVQFVLSETITAQDDELSDLAQQVAGLADALGLEQNRSTALDSELGELNGALSDAQNQSNQQSALIATLTQQRNAAQVAADSSAARITDYEAQIASLISQNRDLGSGIADAQTTALEQLDAKEAAQIALASARSEMDSQAQEARLAAARAEALRALIDDLEAGQADRQSLISDMQSQIASVSQALFLAEAAKRAAQETGAGRADTISQLTLERDAALRQLAESQNSLADSEALLSENTEAQTALATQLRAQVAALTEARRALGNELSTEQLARVAVLQQLVEAETHAEDAANVAAQTADEKARLEALLADRENTIAAAELALAERASALSDAERGQLAEAAAAEALRARLSNADAELTAMTLALEAERQRAEDTLTQLAALRAAERELAGSEADNVDTIENQQIALAEAERLLSLEKDQSADAQRQVALLNQQTAALRGELNQLQGLLNSSNAADEAAQIQIESLGSELNTALARVAAEERARADAERRRADAESRENLLLAEEAERLAAEANDLRSFRSEFFGRMREVLGGREELQIVGDRFVFSSEVLFEPGSADLGAQGQNQLSDLAGVVRELANQIPPEINWILQVEGHTDSTGNANDNWVLSQERALSVVRYLIDNERLSGAHLSAAGFGEYQPLTQGDSPEALAENRRIELKLTER